MPITTSPKRPAGYARISEDDKKDGQGRPRRDGVTRQEADIRAECKRRGWPAPIMYTDNDLSASRFSRKARPEWNRLLADLSAGTVDAMVVWRIDRSTRMGLIGAGRLLEALNVAKTPLVSCTEQIDTSTAAGEIILGVLASIAKAESENISMRVKRKHIDLAAAGKANGGGVRPYGYADDRVTLVPSEAKIIREAARRVLAGEPVGAVVRDLNERGVSTAKGSRWDGTTLKRQLVSGRVAGLREHLGVTTGKGEWKPIITMKEHKKLRALLGGPHVPSLATSPPTARAYLLTGYVVCGECGAKMTAHPAAGVRRYFCLKTRGGCNRVGIGAEPTEDIITEAVMIRLDGADLPRPPKDDDQKDVAAEIDTLEARSLELADVFAQGQIGRAEWIKARDGIEARLDVARQNLRREVRDTSADDYVGGKLRRAWPRMTLDQRRAVVGALVDQIVIAQSTAGGRFDPNRIGVIWRA